MTSAEAQRAVMEQTQRVRAELVALVQLLDTFAAAVNDRVDEIEDEEGQA